MGVEIRSVRSANDTCISHEALVDRGISENEAGIPGLSPALGVTSANLYTGSGQAR